MSAWSWLKTNSDEVGALAAIAGIVVGIVGFGFTIWQIRDTTKALRATNTYTIQHDARELINGIDLKRLTSATIKPEEMPEVETDAWKMFNFYLSVYRQVKAGGVVPEFGESFRGDFCQFLGHPNISALWSQLVTSKRLGPSNVKMREEWCGK